MSRFVLLGHPVGHSLSPVIHTAAYAALGVEHQYEALDIPGEAELAHTLKLVRDGVIEGANVTVPWKQVALRLSDEADESATNVGAANVLVRRHGLIVAYNTDVPALSEELARGAPAARNACVIGSGGAALAAAAACVSLGYSCSLTARRFTSKTPASEWPNATRFANMGVHLAAWPEASGDDPGRSDWEQWVRHADVLVQATSAGMLGADSGLEVSRRVPWRELERPVFAYDLVYNPVVTPFVRDARDAGHAAESGLGMLVGQAAYAIQLWLGTLPPRPPLLAAARRKLEER